ncbi:hypothetical protein [Paenibacillus pini]|uniref:Uncharacterized protein n=1 Tax=Paenibacillus pini JCM 16418 TaxID=1236976 RepID=W7YU96_9BACL|nr:hypothetical protein [Paenibacillus pini]GAF08146.1 hypothetical protein JCM16418_2186 [Paenibacillus pini JCM 16418]
MNHKKGIRWLSLSLFTLIFLLALPLASFAESSQNVTESDLVITYDCSSTETLQIWTIKNPTSFDYSSSWPNGGYWIARNHTEDGQGWIVKDHWLPNIAAGEEVSIEFNITKWGEFSGQNIPARLDIANKDYKSLQYKPAVCEVEKKIDIQFDRTEGSKTYFNVTNTTNKDYAGQWYAFVKNELYANDGYIRIPNDGQPHQLVVNYWDLKNKPLTKLILADPDSGWLGANKPLIAVWIP